MNTVSFRASKHKLCPVCNTGTKGCSGTKAGLHFCRGIASDLPPPDGWRELKSSPDNHGFRHFRRIDDPPAGKKSKRRNSPKPSNDWHAEAVRYAKSLDEQAKAELSRRLHLPIEAIDTVPLVGTNCIATDGRTYTFPECDAAGNIIGINRRFPDGSKKMLSGGHRGLTLPTGWRDLPGPVFIVEGASDTLAMTYAGLAVVGRPSNTGGADLLTKLLRNEAREIVIVGENDQKQNGDWPGRNGAETVAKRLVDSLCRPIPVVFPPDGVKDARAWLTDDSRSTVPWNERGEKLIVVLYERWQCFEPSSEPVGNKKPEIVIGVDEHRVNTEAVEALARDDELYQRARLLVRVIEANVHDDDKAAVRRPDPMPVIKELPNALLRERLTWCAHWQIWRGSGEDAELVPAHPPEWCISAVGAKGDWPTVRRLEAVVPHPAILPTGCILATNGYDAISRLLVTLPAGLSVNVPDKPTREDVKAAVDLLSDAVGDFPFATEAHKAAWFAGLLTPLAWFAFEGPAPLFLIDANIRAAGKGLLADVTAIIVTGRRFPVMSYSSDREELRKRITTLAVEGERMVLLDNLAGGIGNDILDAALTADRWKDRILGGNKVYDGPLHVVWFGTGNNVQLHADTARRVCHCRLESPHERPETRTDVKRTDLREYVRQNRGALLSASLAILKGWFVAGRPTHGLTPWGSFEGWSNVVREAVVFAGLPDPGETRIELQSTADRDALAMSVLIDALEKMDTERRGVTTAEIVETIRKPADPAPDWLPDLRSAVEELCGKLDSRSLGYRFRHFARRNFSGKMLDKSSAPHGSNRWLVISASGRKHPHHHNHPNTPAGGDGGDSGNGPFSVEHQSTFADIDLSAIKH